MVNPQVRPIQFDWFPVTVRISQVSLMIQFTNNVGVLL